MVERTNLGITVEELASIANAVKGAVGVLAGGRGVRVLGIGTRGAEGICGSLEFLLLLLQEGISGVAKLGRGAKVLMIRLVQTSMATQYVLIDVTLVGPVIVQHVLQHLGRLGRRTFRETPGRYVGIVGSFFLGHFSLGAVDCPAGIDSSDAGQTGRQTAPSSVAAQRGDKVRPN